ncbi:uncharacterized protein LOC119558264 [Drosophila subpulchrella]|uniref:uncharacterized protein LOC119558264 n=1 Tax=Drosophila subpulchrella TaxID=1486046 RepID=UPI0018A18457|nr:uncharacterized protein LOC119558264 [Drosophila subpulchrella]
MCAAVCVVVTVPTEAEELRINPRPLVSTQCCSSCGGCLRSKDSEVSSSEVCERCWRLGQIAGSNGCEVVAPAVHTAPAPRYHSRALQLPDLKEDASLEQLLRAIAEELRLEDVFWSHDVPGKQLQARFDLLQDERYERLLCTLQDWGIGERPGTHVSALTCLETRAKPSSQNPCQGHGDFVDQGQEQSQGWQSFMDSVRCRLNVNQVVRQVRRDATLTFDFVVLLMAAALLSCVGLVENSFLFLSSSMLISPLMGPIIAAIFGSVIGDRELRWLGLKNELLGIAVSVGIGFFFGAIVCGFGHFFAISTGLTEEIVSRCDTHSLAIGVCTALASGAAGAIAVLGGNTGSLVGVAISASLLPPAVNAGLLWALAIGSHLLPADHELLASLMKHRTYSSQLSVELLICAAVSMALTLLNIMCVWIMGVVVLRIKEVAPAVQRHQQFWRHDVRTAREVGILDPALQSAIDRLDESQLDVEAPHYQQTWSPGMDCHAVLHPDMALASLKDQPDNYHTVHGFHEFCITLHRLRSEPKGAQPPSVMELFARPEPSSAQTTTNTGGSCFSSCRSLPDISSHSRLCPHGLSSGISIQSLCLSPNRDISYGPMVPTASSAGRDGGKRNVHWQEKQRERALGRNTERDLVLRKEILSSRESSPLRRTGQVLIPLPSLQPTVSADRPLQLLPYARPQVETHDEEQNEFQA